MIPIFAFCIISSKHKNKDICIRIKSLLPLWFIYIGNISCCLCSTTTQAQIYNFKFCISNINGQNILQNIWICLTISWTFSESNRISYANNFCFTVKWIGENTNKKGNKFLKVNSSISIFADLFKIQSILICPFSSSSSLSSFCFFKWDESILVSISLYKLRFECLTEFRGGERVGWH